MVHIKEGKGNRKQLQQEVQQALKSRSETIGLRWLACDPGDDTAVQQCADGGIRAALERGSRDIEWAAAEDETAWLQINADTRFQIGNQKLRPVEKLCSPQSTGQDNSSHDLRTFDTPWGIILLMQGPSANESLTRLENMIWQYAMAHHKRSVQYQRINVSPTQEVHVVTTTDLSQVQQILNMSTRQSSEAEKPLCLTWTSFHTGQQLEQQADFEGKLQRKKCNPLLNC